MLHEEKKVTKIIEELTIFFFSIGGDDISSKIQCKEKICNITFRSNFKPEYEYKLDIVEKNLISHREEEVEDIYWELAGSGDPGETSQLLLIGMMVDKAEVIREDGSVTIRLEKSL